jgi:hypothetical protein
MTSKKDYLDEDVLLPPDQKYVCLSFFVPENKEIKNYGIKIRGCFSTYEEACEHAKVIQNMDKYHNVFVGDMGKWLPFNPDPDDVKDNEYSNNDLNELMKGYKKNQDRSKMYQEIRKNETVMKNIDENILASFKNKKELKEKLDGDLEDSDKTDILNNLEQIDAQLKKMQQKRDDIELMDNTLKEKLEKEKLEKEDDQSINL